MPLSPPKAQAHAHPACFHQDALLEGEVQVRVWNSRNELLGMSPLTLTSPGSDACRSWGLEQLYCVPHMKCVASCDACKIFGGKGVEDTTQFGHTCATGCPENKVWLQIHRSGIQALAGDEADNPRCTLRAKRQWMVVFL